MNTSLLLPSRYKWIGAILLVPGLVLGILWRFTDFQFGFLDWGKAPQLFDDRINFTDELALTLIITGLLFIAFAREKEEDEYIARLRLESLQWAVIVNYVLLVIATWLVHGMAYIDVMMYNMLTVLLFFITRFHLVLRGSRKTITE